MKTLQKSYAFSFPFCLRIPHTAFSIYIYSPKGSSAITWTRRKGCEKSVWVFHIDFKLSADIVDQPHDLKQIENNWVICEIYISVKYIYIDFIFYTWIISPLFFFPSFGLIFLKYNIYFTFNQWLIFRTSAPDFLKLYI